MKQRDRGGFTLIELIVVVAIISMVLALVIPGITSYLSVSINSAAREVASTIKEAFNSSVVTGNVYRIAYNFKDEEFWVEAGPRNALLDTQATREKEERRRRFGDQPEAPSPFVLDRTITRKKISLPRGVTFEDVLTEQSKDPITTGTAYTHFFPTGLAEQTIVHLKDEAKHHVSLVISPLIGRTELYRRYVTPEEAFGK